MTEQKDWATMPLHERQRAMAARGDVKEPRSTTPRRFFGDTLPNGATVIEQRGEFVLCHVNWGSDPFVTWRVSASGEAESGHYFRDVVTAADDLGYRAEGEANR